MPSSDYTPDLEDIGALTRTRTRDNFGNELGTFTLDTRPDNGDVDLLIAKAVSYVEGVAAAGGIDVTTGIPASCVENMQSAVEFRVAQLIEIDFFPEQTASDNSRYQDFKDLYEIAIRQVARCLGINNPDDDTSDSGGSNQDDTETILPQFGFPVRVQGMEAYLERRTEEIGAPWNDPCTWPGVVTGPVTVSEVGDGIVWVNGASKPILRLPLDIGGSGVDIVAVPAVAGRKIRVISAHALARAAAATLTFNSKGSGVGTAISPIYDNGAHGGFVFPKDKDGIFETNVGEALTVTTGAAIGLMISYVEV